MDAGVDDSCNLFLHRHISAVRCRIRIRCGRYSVRIHYKVISQTGPAHDRTFVVNVMFNDIVLATGSGKSKKAAEEEAAKNALAKRSV